LKGNEEQSILNIKIREWQLLNSNNTYKKFGCYFKSYGRWLCLSKKGKILTLPKGFIKAEAETLAL